MSVQIAEAKAPWVMFERRGVEDREKSMASGQYMERDVDFVLVTPHGSRDQVEIEVQDWFRVKEQDVREGRFDAAWLKAYKTAYAEWKEGREIPLEGTPIINWPLLSPAQVRLLQELRCLTVEVLANANEELIKRLGMGGRSLVDKAKSFLAQRKDGKVAEEVTSLKIENEGLKHNLETLAEQVRQLKMQIPAGPATSAGAPQDQGPGINAADLFTDDTPPKGAAAAGLRKL